MVLSVYAGSSSSLILWYTSSRWTGASFGASIPILTWLPVTFRTVTSMSSPIIRVSPTLLVNISTILSPCCVRYQSIAQGADISVWEYSDKDQSDSIAFKMMILKSVVWFFSKNFFKKMIHCQFVIIKSTMGIAVGDCVMVICIVSGNSGMFLMV